jgi:hypothetical protein
MCGDAGDFIKVTAEREEREEVVWVFSSLAESRLRACD